MSGDENVKVSSTQGQLTLKLDALVATPVVPAKSLVAKIPPNVLLKVSPKLAGVASWFEICVTLANAKKSTVTVLPENAPGPTEIGPAIAYPQHKTAIGIR